MAYVVGLMATDGHLSVDGRHLDLTSKDIEQLENFKKCLKINTKISWKSSGYGGKCSHVQFSDVKFYRWLQSIGVNQKKTNTIAEIKIPEKYFFDFLRGSFDGDGCVYAYYDPRWVNSYLLYAQFCSGSLNHLKWLNNKIKQFLCYEGRITYQGKNTFKLRYSKYASLDLFKKMYYKKGVVCLSRKKIKFEKFVQQAKKTKSFLSTGMSARRVLGEW